MDLRERISLAITTATADVLQNSWPEIEYSFDVYRGTNEARGKTY